MGLGDILRVYTFLDGQLMNLWFGQPCVRYISRVSRVSTPPNTLLAFRSAGLCFCPFVVLSLCLLNVSDFACNEL